MIVSWNWLKDYVPCIEEMHDEEVYDSLTLSGLNFESCEGVGDDLAIDLEVTSNRPDCLGHIGIAREISVLWEKPLQLPAAQPKGTAPGIETLTNIEIQCPDLCPRYTARLMRGVKIGPSPKFIADRLQTLGIAVINNVVDITNYVMMECGQPLHAFDFAKLKGRKIIVREAKPGEPFMAIDHKEYKLSAGQCVIADAERPVALGGVMGGADTEVSSATKEVLLEAADFDAMAVRSAARSLNLHSPSSYRFERCVDPEGIDWASRRACELMLEHAGGELAEGVIDIAGTPRAKPKPIVLRLSQVERILGISIPETTIRSILTALGNVEQSATSEKIEVLPPSHRADLAREIDLIEEVARIHGYEKIPEDVRVPMAASKKTELEIVIEKVNAVLVAAGLCEAKTNSAVDREWISIFQPWSPAEPLVASTPVLRRANSLRQSMVPSLLSVRRTNETLSNPHANLFEIAKIYLPKPGELPTEPWVLSMVLDGGFTTAKGIIEAIVARVAPSAALAAARSENPFFIPGRGAELTLNGKRFGFLGEVASEKLKTFELRSAATIAEIDLDVLVASAEFIHKLAPLSNYPPIDRDLNMVLDEQVLWSDVERIVLDASGPLLESLSFQEEYRDAKHLGPGKKSLLFSIRLRSHEGTLTNQEADALRDQIVARLNQSLGGTLRT